MYVNIGKNKFRKDENGLPEQVNFDLGRYYGVYTISAMTRWGKSALSKIIYTALAEENLKRKRDGKGITTPLVIFDYRGEHGDSRYPYFLSKNEVRGIIDLHTIEDFAFMISDYTHISDWVSFGFEQRGAELMSKIAADVESHNNDPEQVQEMIDWLPLTSNAMSDFWSRYPSAQSYVRMPQHSGKVASMSANFSIIKHYFFDGSQNYIANFGEEMYNHRHLHINLNLTPAEERIAKANVGKILEQIHNYLEVIRCKHGHDRWVLKPFFVFEEADILAPAYVEAPLPSSLYWIYRFVLKFQKYGPKLMFITQDPALMFPELVSNSHTLLLGKLPQRTQLDATYREKTEKLGRPGGSNRGEFVKIEVGKEWQYEVFTPNDMPCMG